MKSVKLRNFPQIVVLSSLTAGIVLLTVLPFSGKLHWLFELTAHFRFQYMITSIVLLCIVSWLRYWRLATVALGCFLLNFVFIAPYYFPQDIPEHKTSAIRILSFNILRDNSNIQSIQNLVDQERPDIIAFYEITPELANRFQNLTNIYPYEKSIPQPGSFGIWLLSSIPLDNITVKYLKETPAIVSAFTYEGTEIFLIAAHTFPPVGARAAKLRNEQLRELENLVSQNTGPTVVVGDLNITPWSPYFQDFISNTQLRDARKGFGINISWPAISLLSLGSIPIDHCLVSPDVYVKNFEIESSCGSDHFSLVVDLYFAKNRATDEKDN